MGKSELENFIVKATSENNVNEDWGLFMDIIDFINQNNCEKDALRIITKRLNDRDPHVSLHSLALLNACVKNCNNNFKLEVSSRMFIECAKQFILSTNHPKLSEKFSSMIKNWCNEPEFKNDPALNLMQSLYVELLRNGISFGEENEIKTMKSTSSSMLAAQRKEEDDLAKAIALSIKESFSSHSLNNNNQNQESKSVSSFYASKNVNPHKSERQKVKALYDFEAVEDNEITFKAGDILYVTDSSDQNWWKGIDQTNNEGLFPSNFVTSDLEYEEEDFRSSSNSKKVSFNDKVNVQNLEKDEKNSIKHKIHILIDETKIDECIELMQNADPTGEIQPDSQEMLLLEDQCYMMGPLIDQQLQKIDYKHAILDDVNIKIIEAFQMYNNLMKESISKTTNLIQPMMTNNNLSSTIIPHNPGNYIPYFSGPQKKDNNLSTQSDSFTTYNQTSSETVDVNQMTHNQQFNPRGLPHSFQSYNSSDVYQQYVPGVPQQHEVNNQLQNRMNP